MARSKKFHEWTEDDWDDVIEETLERMCEGFTVAETGRYLGFPPGRIRRRIALSEEYTFQYRASRLMMASHYADRALELAKNAENQTVTRDRLEIDTLRWAAARMNPQEFGDKHTVDMNLSPTLEIKVIEDSLPEPKKPPQLARVVSETPNRRKG